LACGADLWECDVNLTADGIPVILHDDTLKRTSNAMTVFPARKPWKVNSFTLNELRQLDFGSWFMTTDPFKQISEGNVSATEQGKFAGETIPTLEEALIFTKENNWQINVEIKDLRGTPGDATIVEKVLAPIRDLNMEDHVWISSFNHLYISTVKQLIPVIRTGALVEWLDLNPLARLKQTGAQSYNPGIRLASSRTIRSIREAGLDVFVWTVNKEASMRKLIKAGVSGIITDFPQVLKSVLDGYSR
jgi:glycerophosphoryl diester phosphodiesterase